MSQRRSSIGVLPQSVLPHAPPWHWPLSCRHRYQATETYSPPAMPPAISDLPMEVHDKDLALDISPGGSVGLRTLSGFSLI